MAGGLDEVLNRAVPGGFSKPLMIALGALLVGKMVGGAFAGASATGGGKPQSDPTRVPQSGADAGSQSGLGGLLQKLGDAGHEDKANSWIGSGQNQPIEPHQLGAALGPTAVSEVAQQSGLSEQELLVQLARSLPAIVDQLTPNGRLPNTQELRDMFTRGLQTTAR